MPFLSSSGFKPAFPPTTGMLYFEQTEFNVVKRSSSLMEKAVDTEIQTVFSVEESFFIAFSTLSAYLRGYLSISKIISAAVSVTSLNPKQRKINDKTPKKIIFSFSLSNSVLSFC